MQLILCFPSSTNENLFTEQVETLVNGVEAVGSFIEVDMTSCSEQQIEYVKEVAQGLGGYEQYKVKLVDKR
jgi:adenylate cyclase class IV